MSAAPDDVTTPTIDEVRTFIALAVEQSFAAAAVRLRCDPTAVSRRLGALEARLGVQLADRTTRRFALTEAGHMYLGRMKPLLDEFDIAAREASAFATGAPRGRLRVTLPGSFARLWLDPLVVSFVRAHPEISFEALYSNRFVDLVGEGFDAAIRLGVLSDSRLVARKVASRRRLICASPGYLAARGVPISPAEVADHDCLCFTGRPEPYLWLFRRLAKPVSVAGSCRMSSDDADLLVAAACGGLGLFYTTDWHAGPHLTSGRLVEVLEDQPIADDGAIYILTPAGDRMPSKTRAFSDWIAAGLERPPWLGTLETDLEL